jgi:hypothetical protein
VRVARACQRSIRCPPSGARSPPAARRANQADVTDGTAASQVRLELCYSHDADRIPWRVRGLEAPRADSRDLAGAHFEDELRARPSATWRIGSAKTDVGRTPGEQPRDRVVVQRRDHTASRVPVPRRRRHEAAHVVQLRSSMAAVYMPNLGPTTSDGFDPVKEEP